MDFLRLSEQPAIVSLNSNEQLMFVTEEYRVFFEVLPGFHNVV
jgi:hypothetical protein